VFVTRVGRVRQLSFPLKRSPNDQEFGEPATILRAAVETLLADTTRN
jgi:hypothetical protein